MARIRMTLPGSLFTRGGAQVPARGSRWPWTRSLLAAAAALTLPACSPEALRRGSYETLHNISDAENRDDPKYDSPYEQGKRPSYEVYRQEREELLRKQRETLELPAPLVRPSSPPQP